MILRKIQYVLALSSTLGMVALALPLTAKPLTFQVNDEKKRDTVSFTSDAPLELIVGHTNNVSGTVTVDDSLDLSKKPLDATFDVDLTTIDTGIPLRNEHMRDNFLETPKYPKAVFKLRSLAKPGVLKPNTKTRIMAVGDFTLHGKTVSKTVPVDVTYYKPCAATKEKRADCDIIQISAQFPVAFKDHSIKRPEVVFQKLSDNVLVKVGATAWRKPETTAKATTKDEKPVLKAAKKPS
jgi:polyisoprenoid-binding protein YceI